VALEKVTGKPAAEVYQERIFGPLGMAQTSFLGMHRFEEQRFALNEGFLSLEAHLREDI
jgi:CubicO group peptidase (beta-lactamase class C family)